MNKLDAAIIGGSYAGLSAALALGRAMRKVLIIDAGSPCNRFAPHSHNFLTQDGESPAMISSKARVQLEKYKSVSFLNDWVDKVEGMDLGFEVQTKSGQLFSAKKLILATGVRDVLPDIQGFSDCWGKSIIHCPYCHGYEVKLETTGILADGDVAYHYAQLIRNWTKNLTLYTNGSCSLSEEQKTKIQDHNIRIIEKKIQRIEHKQGQMEALIFEDGTRETMRALYTRPHFEQSSELPKFLGCETTEKNLLKVDPFYQTTIPGVMACGDNASPLRSVANAVASGNIVGAMTNNQLTEEEFE